MMKAAENWRSDSREIALSVATPFLLYLRRHFQDLTCKSFLHLVCKPNASIHSDLQKMNLRYPTFKQREHNLLSIDFITIRAIFGESKVHGHPSVLHIGQGQRTLSSSLQFVHNYSSGRTCGLNWSNGYSKSRIRSEVEEKKITRIPAKFSSLTICAISAKLVDRQRGHANNLLAKTLNGPDSEF